MTEIQTNIPHEELLFYDIMEYPVPKQREYFVCTDKATQGWEEELNSSSRTVTQKTVKEYLTYINKWNRLFRSLPFIKTIYLCNSITFNSIHEESDIDVFIVVKDKALRRARFWSVLIFRILWLKRSQTHKKKKFCLSFYVTESHQNLYNISLSKTDIYLAYRIAHLVPIYEEVAGNSTIYKHNSRIHGMLPNNPGKQSIFLDITCTTGSNKFKKMLEFLQKWRWGKLIELSIKTLWLPIIIYKIKRLHYQGQDIIVNNYMLKFYADKRKKIALLYKIRRDKFITSKNKDNK
jgi:predicted nucleotidyltransferase